MIYLVLKYSYEKSEVIERQAYLYDTFGVYFKCSIVKNMLLFTSVPESYEDNFIFVIGDTPLVSMFLKGELSTLKNKILSIDTCHVTSIGVLNQYNDKKIFVSKNLKDSAYLYDDTGYGFKISKTEMNLNRYAYLPTIEKLKKASYLLHDVRRDNYAK